MATHYNEAITNSALDPATESLPDSTIGPTAAYTHHALDIKDAIIPPDEESRQSLMHDTHNFGHLGANAM
ncbi:hypothetical protein BGX21_005498, partial [Mortierella sp. AD011]